MQDASGTVRLILEFVDLAIARRRRAVPAEARARLEALEESIRDLVDGARPAPRKIEGRPTMGRADAGRADAGRADAGRADAGRAEADGGPPSRPAAVQAPRAAAAEVAKKPGKPGTQSISDLVDKLDLTPGDRQKLKREVRLESLPRSGYTPSKAPTYLDDYYSTDIVLTGDIAWAAPPRRVVRADGEGELEVPKEALMLFGLAQGADEGKDGAAKAEAAVVERAKPGLARPAAPSATGTSAPQTSRGRPAIVHLLTGGVLRGQIDLFDPASGSIDLLGEQTTGEDNRLAVSEVLAVFFGLLRGEELRLPDGQRVAVRLVNDRQITGITEDYREGGDSLTIAPEQKRGNVHRIWVPAWAVKEIQLV